MSKQQYLWMLGLIAAWRQQVDSDDQDGPRLLLQAIYAQAGTFKGAPTKAANDLAAALFILLLIWWWNYAIYHANVAATGAFSRKLTRRQFLGAVPLHPAWLRLFPDSEAPLGLCHIPCSLTSRGAWR